MPQYQPGMYYSPDYAPNDQVPVTSQADLDNLIAAGINVQTPNVTPTTTPTNSWQDYMNQAGDILSGMQSSTTVEDIRARERAERERIAEAANSIFNPKLEQSRILGEKQVGSGEAQIGQSRGLGMSSAETSYVASIQKEVDDRYNDILKAKAEYISAGNFAAADRAEAALQKLEEAKNNLILQKTDLALKLYSAGRDEAKFNFDIVSSLGKGQTWTDPVSGKTYTGIAESEVDPFFSGSDIVSLMKTLPSGTTQTLTDPNTGEEYTLTGLSTDNPNIKTMQATDASGNVTITTYRISDQGAEIINQVSAGRVGKGSRGSGGGTTKFLTRAKLNQLNAAGIDDATANSIASQLSSSDPESTINSLALNYEQAANPNMSVAYASPENIAKARNLVNKYISETNKVTLQDQIASLLGGGSSSEIIDTTFEDLGE